MALLNSFNLIFLRISILFTIAYFSVTNVDKILSNSYIEVFTDAMNLPSVQISPYSTQLGIISLLFIFMGLNDLIPLLEDNKQYFLSMVPFRLLCFFIITGLSYFMMDNYFIHNNIVFIYSFMEIWLNFLIYNCLRDERNEDFKLQNKLIEEAELH